VIVRRQRAACPARVCAGTLFGWDGDTLAYESALEQGRTTHYVYEPGSFVPLLQARADTALYGIDTPVYAGDYAPANVSFSKSDPETGIVVEFNHCDPTLLVLIARGFRSPSQCKKSH
jgi:hypothetical protein